MVLALFLAAATTLPTPIQASDLRCVALLAIVANEQRRGTGWTQYRDLQRDGARFAGVVGDDIVATTGETREAVRDQIVAQVARLQRGGELTRTEVDACAARVTVRAPAPPPPSLPRCAAIMGLAYDAVRARDGMTKDAKDLATLASVLTYRMRTELGAQGKSGSEIDALLAAERDKAANTGGAPQDELEACADLAAPDGAK